MADNIYLLIAESMQLAIVALIVIICIFNPRLAILKAESNHPASFFGSFFRNYIALGFLTNLVYMLCNLGQAKSIGWFDKDGTSNAIATIADICTASAFLYGSLEGRVNKQNRWLLGGGVIIISFALGIFNFHKEHFPLHLYSLLTYSAVSIYVFTQVGNAKREIKNIFSTWTFGVGFSVWALLQLLPIWVDLTDGDLEPMKIYGFSGSTIGKALILLGIYYFSMRMAKTATLQERKQNEALALKQESIRALPELINQVSNAPSTEAHAQRVVEHLTSRKIFDFDYTIFSEVDYLHRKIISKKARKDHPNVKEVDDWVVNSGVSFNSPDIMARVVNERVTKYVYGNQITIKTDEGPKTYRVDLTKADPELNPEVFNKYQHMNLDRVFIPVFNVNDKISIAPVDEQINPLPRVIAIIEAGKFVQEKKNYKSGVIKSEDELKLYLDNASQAYQRLYEEDIHRKIDMLLEDCHTVTKDDHMSYIRKVINGVCRETQIDGVALCLFYKNRTTEANHKDYFYSAGQDHVRKQLEDYIDRYIDHKINNKEPEDQNREWLQSRVLQLTRSKSFKCYDIFVDGTIQAYWVFYAKEASFFNDVVNFFISSVIRRMVHTFNEKKFHSSTAKLISPNNAITDLELNIKPLIGSLQDYFETSFVTFWKKEESGAIFQQYGSEPIQQSFKGFKSVEVNSADVLAIQQPLVYTETGSSFYHQNKNLAAFITKHNIQTILHKPLMVDDQVLGAISVFFKESINPNSDDISYLNLVAVKTQINFQIFNLISAFRTISDSFTRNDLEATQKTITEQAMKLLNADPVILFRSYDGRDIFFKDSTLAQVLPFFDPATSGSFGQKDVHVDIAEKILSDKTRFFDNYGEFERYADLKETGVSNFWVREKLESMAAIRLSNKIGNIDKAVGVMFINFRSKVAFAHNEELQNIVETFASFAASSIANGYVMQRNMQYLIRNIQLSEPVLDEIITQGTLHDARKDYLIIYERFKHLLQQIDGPNYGNNKIDVTGIRALLEKMRPSVFGVHEHFKSLHHYQQIRKNLLITQCDLSKLIQRKLDSLDQDMRTKHIELIDHFSNANLIADCDEGLLGDALYNIMNNACQAMRPHDKLEVRLNKIDNETHARIDIIDTGPGINKDIQQLILKPYITDKPGGSGLGLPMANYTVERHGGTLNYDTNRGKTTFTITIPIDQPITEEE